MRLFSNVDDSNRHGHVFEDQYPSNGDESVPSRSDTFSSSSGNKTDILGLSPPHDHTRIASHNELCSCSGSKCHKEDLVESIETQKVAFSYNQKEDIIDSKQLLEEAVFSGSGFCEDKGCIDPLNPEEINKVVNAISSSKSKLLMKHLQLFIIFQFAIRNGLLDHDQIEYPFKSENGSILVAFNDPHLFDQFKKQVWVPQEMESYDITQKGFENALKSSKCSIGIFLFSLSKFDVHSAISSPPTSNSIERIEETFSAWNKLQQKFKQHSFCVMIKEHTDSTMKSLQQHIPASLLPTYGDGHLVVWRKSDMELNQGQDCIQKISPLTSSKKWRRSIFERQLIELIEREKRHTDHPPKRQKLSLSQYFANVLSSLNETIMGSPKVRH